MIKQIPTKFKQARRTGIEPATTGVTSRYSNQLSYHPNRNSELKSVAISV